MGMRMFRLVLDCYCGTGVGVSKAVRLGRF
jgi:hypothetical protein